MRTEPILHHESTAPRAQQASARTVVWCVAWAVACCTPLAMVSACEPPLPCESVNGPYEVEIGMGVQAFEPLEDGDTVGYTAGIQGGTHLDGAARTRNLWIPADLYGDERDMPRVTFQSFLGEDVVGGYADLPRPFRRDGDTGLLLGDPLIFRLDASAYVGQTLRLSIDVEDLCGHRAHDERRVVIDAFSGAEGQ